ncbi:hypothetical protein DAI22_11g111366 [Oryza sativa Japonica Group]|nr:hypothetical protein DAI22_11g111366 [Oryza sativa Japonica Group]
MRLPGGAGTAARRPAARRPSGVAVRRQAQQGRARAAPARRPGGRRRGGQVATAVRRRAGRRYGAWWPAGAAHDGAAEGRVAVRPGEHRAAAMRRPRRRAAGQCRQRGGYEGVRPGGAGATAAAGAASCPSIRWRRGRASARSAATRQPALPSTAFSPFFFVSFFFSSPFSFFFGACTIPAVLRAVRPGRRGMVRRPDKACAGVADSQAAPARGTAARPCAGAAMRVSEADETSGRWRDAPVRRQARRPRAWAALAPVRPSTRASADGEVDGRRGGAVRGGRRRGERLSGGAAQQAVGRRGGMGSRMRPMHGEVRPSRYRCAWCNLAITQCWRDAWLVPMRFVNHAGDFLAASKGLATNRQDAGDFKSAMVVHSLFHLFMFSDGPN